MRRVKNPLFLSLRLCLWPVSMLMALFCSVVCTPWPPQSHDLISVTSVPGCSTFFHLHCTVFCLWSDRCYSLAGKLICGITGSGNGAHVPHPGSFFTCLGVLNVYTLAVIIPVCLPVFRPFVFGCLALVPDSEHELHCNLLKGRCISRVPEQNGASLLYIMIEIHHSGWEPSNCVKYCFGLLFYHI